MICSECKKKIEPDAPYVIVMNEADEPLLRCEFCNL